MEGRHNLKTLIGLIVVFLAIVYIYTFLKIRKKRKNKTPDAIQSFHQKYDHILHRPEPDKNQTEHKNQITRYNSTVDYITREDLFENKAEDKKRIQ